MLAAKSPMSWSKLFLLKSLEATAFSTLIFGSVIVPVLSTQSTLTRAKVSTLFISWSITCFRARRTAESANAIVVKRYKPSGIIPIIAASMETILRYKDMWLTKKLIENSAIPRGIMIMPTHLINLLIERTISDCSLLPMALALIVSLEM